MDSVIVDWLDLREKRAGIMLKDGLEPEEIKEDTYNVPSQSSNKSYTVTQEGPLIWKCTCPDHEYRRVTCKHILAVQMWRDIKAKIQTHETLDEIIDGTYCKHCNSTDVIKNGTRKNKLTVKTRYLCKSCNKTFTLEEREVFAHMKFNAETITLCLDLYFKGFSLRKVQEHLQHFHSIKLNYSTVSLWIRKYTQIINEYVKTLKPELGHTWQTDEMAIKAKGDHKWLWNVMDKDTRFLLATMVTKRRSIKEARNVFRGAKEQAKARPRVMVTDGLWSYKKAFNREFYACRGPRPFMIRHVHKAGPSTVTNNNIVERLNGTIREREKVMRGMQNEKTAQELIEGFKNYYNFIRPHQALNGKTPAEMAGLDLNLGDNKWLGLIEKASEEIIATD